jgi:hypothetical protein
VQRPAIRRSLLAVATTVALVATGCGAAPGGSSGSAAPASSARADAALDSFFTTIAEPGELSFHIHQAAELGRQGVPFISTVLDLDVSGSDFAGHESAGSTSLQIGFDLVVVGDAGWVRPDGEDWTEVAATELSPGDVLDVWRHLPQGEDLSFERVDADGALHFRSTTPRAYEAASLRTSGLTAEVVDAELILQADGTPVSLTLLIEGGGTIDGQVVELTGSTVAEFSRWGEEIAIEPPR